MPSNTTAISDRLKELKQSLSEKTAELDQITSSWETSPDGKTVSYTADQEKAFNDRTAEARSIMDTISSMETYGQIKGYLDRPEGASVAGSDAVNTARDQLGVKSLADGFLDSEDWQEYKQAGYRGGMTFRADDSVWDLPMVGTKDVFSLSAGTVSDQAFGRWQQTDLVERMLRQQHIRDLFPSEQTAAAVIYGIRVTGFTNAARGVAERTASDGSPATGSPTDVFGAKPVSDLTFETITYPMSTVAHLLYAHNTVLDDEPRLRGIINREMIQGVKYAEDAALLTGAGGGTEVRGIFNTAGIQTYNQPTDGGTPAAPTEFKTVTIRRAVTRVQLAELAPTGVVVNPMDWEDMELETDDQGRYLLVTSVAQGAEPRVWRLPVVATTAMPQGTYLVGAFGSGARLYDRQQVNVVVSTENKDLFERNAVTFRAEERICLEVPRPEAFVTGSLFEAA